MESTDLVSIQTHPIVRELLKQPTHEQRSDEWYKQRNMRLTASDAAAALKMNKYNSREELLFKKCGMSKPFVGNVATRWGQKYEDEAIEIYEKFMGKKVHQFGLLNHPTLDCIAGSPCLLYTSPSPRDRTRSRMPSSA